MSARVSKKAPKDANAPKKPLSSYFMFTRDRRAALKSSQPDAKITELTKVIAAEWKELEAATKEKYTAEAAQAKAQYLVKWAEYQKTADFGKHTLQVAAWKAQRGEAEAKASAKKPKDANAPKRPQTAYFAFTAAERVSLKAAHPEMKVTQMAKEMGRRWKALSAKEKAPFEAQAAAAKEAYAAQLATYKQSAEFAAHEEAVAAWKRGLKATANASKANSKVDVKMPRKPKDSKCPKKPQTGYFLFTATRRPELSKAHPDKKITELAKLMGAEWKALSEADKQPFLAKAAEAKAAYALKLKAYKGTKDHKAFSLQLSQWKEECARIKQEAVDQKMAELEVSNKCKANSAKKSKRGKKFVEESSSDESGSDSDSEESSRSYSSSSDEESGSYSD